MHEDWKVQARVCRYSHRAQHTMKVLLNQLSDSGLLYFYNFVLIGGAIMHQEAIR